MLFGYLLPFDEDYNSVYQCLVFVCILTLNAVLWYFFANWDDATKKADAEAPCAPLENVEGFSNEGSQQTGEPKTVHACAPLEKVESFSNEECQQTGEPQ